MRDDGRRPFGLVMILAVPDLARIGLHFRMRSILAQAIRCSLTANMAPCPLMEPLAVRITMALR